MNKPNKPSVKALNNKALALSISLALSATAQAATFNVTSNADNVPNNPSDPNDLCAGAVANTLRWAICQANSAPAVPPAAPHVIQFNAGLMQIEVQNDLPAIQSDLIFNGNGVVVNGSPGNRLFYTDTIRTNYNLSFDTITVQFGNSPSNGGGIFVSGNVTLTNSTLYRNNALASGADGGGIAATGDLTLTNSTVSGNRADDDGGGIYAGGIATLSSSTVTRNRTLSGDGGGIYAGTANLTNSVVAANTAAANNNVSRGSGTDSNSFINGDPLLVGLLQDNGGPTMTHLPLPGSPLIDAIAYSNCGSQSTDQRGLTRPGNTGENCDIGAVEIRQVSYTVTHNGGGGGADADNTTTTLAEAIIAGNMAKANDASIELINIGFDLPADRKTILMTDNLPQINASMHFIGNGMVVDGNNTHSLFRTITPTPTSMSFDRMTIQNGRTDSGGGGVFNTGYLTMTNCTVLGNRADDSGGGIFVGRRARITNTTIANNFSGAYGGGMSADYATVNNSAFSGNEAANGGGGMGVDKGTEIYNTTVAENTAGTRGGGVAVGFLNATNCTITGNTATSAAGLSAITANLTNCVVARNMGTSIQTSGTLTETNSFIDGDPELGPLQFNGGTTQTMLPLPGSPLIDSNGPGITNPSATGCEGSAPATDQRGFVRPIGIAAQKCDIGAVEFKSQNTVVVAKPTETTPVDTALDFRDNLDWTPAEEGLIFIAQATDDGNATVTLTITNNTSGGANGTLSTTASDGNNDGTNATITGSGNTITITGNAVDINATLGTLMFTPPPGVASTFTLLATQNSGGSTASTGTMTITVIALPTGANKTITTNEDTDYSFSTNDSNNDFGFADIDGDSFKAVRIESLSLPSGATLQLSGSNVTTGQSIAVADLGNLVFSPADNASGNNHASFDFRVQDSTDTLATNANTITFDVTAVNDPPTISAISNQSTNEDTATSPIGFTVGDVETAAASLGVTATSSDTSVIPATGIALGGSGANRTVTLTPAENAVGSSTITLTVTDADGGTATSAFILTVNSVNDPPTISAISNQSTNEDTATSPIGFTVGDVETAAASLGVTATSSDTSVIPATGIALGGSGANRTVTLTPAENAVGSSTITLTVTDADGGTATSAFMLTVNPVNDAPSFVKGQDISVTVTPDAEQAPTQAQAKSDVQAVDLKTLALVETFSFPNWATLITPGGGADEASQSLQFELSNLNTSSNLFAVQPAVSSNGTLSFTTSGEAGTAMLSIRLVDNGNTSNGGSNTSAAQTFNITIDRTVAPVPAPVPTMSRIGLALTAGLIWLLGMAGLRRRL